LVIGRLPFAAEGKPKETGSIGLLATLGHCQICRPGARTIWRLRQPRDEASPGEISILTPSSVVKSKKNLAT
jgi:hypothetical protein